MAVTFAAASACRKFGLGIQICCGKILMAAEPGYKGYNCPVSSAFLYRHNVSKFYDSRSGGTQKFRHHR
jgi:hypothetical protein